MHPAAKILWPCFRMQQNFKASICCSGMFPMPMMSILYFVAHADSMKLCPPGIFQKFELWNACLHKQASSMVTCHHGMHPMCSQWNLWFERSRLLNWTHSNGTFPEWRKCKFICHSQAFQWWFCLLECVTNLKCVWHVFVMPSHLITISQICNCSRWPTRKNIFAGVEDFQANAANWNIGDAINLSSCSMEHSHSAPTFCSGMHLRFETWIACFKKLTLMESFLDGMLALQQTCNFWPNNLHPISANGTFPEWCKLITPFTFNSNITFHGVCHAAFKM